MLRLAYGYQSANEDDDAMVKLVNEAMDQFSETSASGAFLVDVFPVRKLSVYLIMLLLFLTIHSIYSPICARMVSRCRVEEEGFEIPKHSTRDGEHSV